MAVGAGGSVLATQDLTRALASAGALFNVRNEIAAAN